MARARGGALDGEACPGLAGIDERAVSRSASRPTSGRRRLRKSGWHQRPLL